MIKTKHGASILWLFSVLLVLCFAGGKANAQTANTCYMNYAFYGPAGSYKIELFEVGAPYPSRQDFALNNYNGLFTYHATWSYISLNRWYFIRVTRVGGPAKQTGEFNTYGYWTNYNAPELNWYNQ